MAIIFFFDFFSQSRGRSFVSRGVQLNFISLDKIPIMGESSFNKQDPTEKDKVQAYCRKKSLLESVPRWQKKRRVAHSILYSANIRFEFCALS